MIPLLKQALEALGAEDSILRVPLLGRLAGALRDQRSIEPRAALGQEAVAMARRIGDPETLTYALLAHWGAAFLGPDADQHDAIAEELDRLAEQVLFNQLAAGELAAFPKDNEWLCALTLLAEAADALGDPDPAPTLYRQLAPYAELVVLTASEVSMGPVSRPLGILASLIGRHDDAAGTSRTPSLARGAWELGRGWRTRSMPTPGCLSVGGRPGDRERAVELLASALEASEELGMIALAARVTGCLAELGCAPGGGRVP